MYGILPCEGSRVNFSAYSITGMWFRGLVIILYFLVPDDSKIGKTCNVTLSDFMVELINPDGSYENLEGYNISTKNGTITITRQLGFLEGEVVDFPQSNPPFKGRGDPDIATETTATAISENAPLYYSITIIVLFMMFGILFIGIMKIYSILRVGRPPKKTQNGGTGEGAADKAFAAAGSKSQEESIKQ